MYPLRRSRNEEVPEALRSPCKGFISSFGFVRKYDIHCGVDLYTSGDEDVFSIDSGMVVAVGRYTGKGTRYPWWRDTDFLAVRSLSRSEVWVYGEVSVNMNIKLGHSLLKVTYLGIPYSLRTAQKQRIKEEARCFT